MNFPVFFGLIAFYCLIFVLYQYKIIMGEYWQVTSARRFAELNKIPLEEILIGPLAQNDPRILNYIDGNKTILEPSVEPYNLTNPDIDPSMGQSAIVKSIFKNMTNRFFVECGALDGETRSNTLTFEKEFGWQGLLIEGDPKNFKLLVEKRRKAWAANVCLATKRFPHQVMFKQQFNVGKILKDLGRETDGKFPQAIKVQCYPLFTLLSALRITTVDYFSLDVEGNEFQVLQNIPFHKILIKVLSVEYIHNERDDSKILIPFMKAKGYRVVAKVNHEDNLANDLIFVHNSVKLTRFQDSENISRLLSYTTSKREPSVISLIEYE